MKRDKSLDLIRACATYFIVTFHFFVFFNKTDSIFYGYANGGWGSVGTTLFFLLSGYALYMKHPVISDIKGFYKKRWVSIYPMFYIAFLLAYFIHAFRGAGFTYGSSMLRLIFILLIVFVKLPWQSLFWKNLLGIAIFLFLHQTSGLLLRIPGVSFCSEKISKYSYAIYLIHHFIMNEFCLQMNGYMPTVHTTLFLYFATVYVIFLFAFIIFQLNAALKRKKSPE